MNIRYRFKFVLRGILLCLVLILIPTLSWSYGFIQGYVRDNSDPPQPIEGARIETDYGFSAVSVSDGSYIMLHYSGTYNITASAPGFTSQSLEVTIADTITTTQDFNLPVSPLTINSVSPKWVQMGEDQYAIINGAGFDEATRIAMYLDSGNRAKIIGSVDTPDHAKGVTVVGKTAYVADYESGLQIIDVSDPANPTIIDSVDTPGSAQGVTVIDSTAYVPVVDGYDGSLQVIDVSDPANPIIRSVDTPGSAEGVTVVDATAYLADGAFGLKVIDVDPASPFYLTPIGSVDNPDQNRDRAKGVTVVSSIAYVAVMDIYGGGSLQVIDVDPASPFYLTIIGSVDTPDMVIGVAVVDNTAYVTGSDGRGGGSLQVIDVSDPASPTIIDSVDTPGSAHEVTVVDSMAYVAGSTSGIQMIDVDPASPFYLTIIGSVDTPDMAIGVTVVGSTAYVACYSSGLQVIDVTDPANPTIIGSVDTPDFAKGVTVVDSTAYVADGDSGLQVIDVANLANPTIIGSVDTPGRAEGVTVVASKAYIADGYSGLQVIDVDLDSPSYLTIIGSVDTFGYALGMAVVDSIAYVADSMSGLQVIDVDPDSPFYLTIIGSHYCLTSTQGVTVVDNIAYTTEFDRGLRMIDVSDPANPTNISFVDTPGSALGVAVADSKVYVADYESGLQVIDITDPANPTIIAHVDTPDYARKVIVIDSKAYVADGSSGLQVIDVTNPAHPTIIGFSDLPANAYEAAVVDKIAYVAGGNSGLQIVPIPVEISPVKIISNSEITAMLPSPQIEGNYTIRVFNALGQYDELPGAVTFSDQMANAKAIIVAGGGPGESNDPNSQWEDIKTNAHYAYNALLWQGYRKENIYYMSAEHYDGSVDIDGNGKDDDVDQDATVPNLEYAINTWAKNPSSPADNLIIYIIAHGYNGMFEMVRQDSYSETNFLKASDLAQWLDNLQVSMPGETIVIYEACKSGSFLPPLGYSLTSGFKRVSITSSEADKDSIMVENGKKSFSYQFWDSVYSSGSLKDAFNKGSVKMSRYQTPRLDADGNGINDADTNLIKNFVIGRNVKTLPGNPWIIRTIDPKTLTGGSTSVELWAEANGDKPISKVRVIATPPGYNPEEGGSDFISLPTVDLNCAAVDNHYYCTANYSGFNVIGEYQVEFTAVDADDKESLPESITITQTEGPDVFEQDDLSESSSIYAINSIKSQHHTFHAAGDQDWNKFYGLAGQTYTIEVFNVDSSSDPVIELYDAESTVIETKNDSGVGGTETLVWTCPQDSDGIYFIKVNHSNPAALGAHTDYDLKIYQSNITSPVSLKGMIQDNENKPVSGAVIVALSTSVPAIKGSGISKLNGPYSLILESGTYDITIIADGCKPQTQAGVDISIDKTFDFTMLPVGSNSEPVADAGSDQIVFDEITLSAGMSSDPDADQLTYTWDIVHQSNPANNRTDTGVSPILSSLEPGFYTATLTVTDPDGLTSTQTMTFSATGPAVWQADYDQTVSNFEQTIADLTDENDTLATFKAYYLYGDFDADGDVDALDLSWFADYYGMLDINIFDDGDFDGFSEYEGDCDDYDDLINPGADEICDDGLDNDCNGVIDEEPCN